MGHVYGDRSA